MLNQPLVFGCGTGRCGTTSLTHLLNAQPGYAITQERHFLPWSVHEEELYAAVHDIRDLSQEYAVVGEVAPWYLPYAAHLIQIYYARVIIMERDRAGMIESYVRQRYNCASLWPENEDRALPFNFYGRMWQDGLPKFPGTPEEAAGALWDCYHALALATRDRWPEAVRIVPMLALNYRLDQIALLTWLGIQDPVCYQVSPDHALEEGSLHDSRQATADWYGYGAVRPGVLGEDAQRAVPLQGGP